MTARLAARAAALAITGALVPAGCGGAVTADEVAAGAAAEHYFAAVGPEVCAYLSRAQLASYAGTVAGETPIAACRAAHRLTVPEGSADVVEHPDPPAIASVEVVDGRARVHALRDGTRSVEVELVLEGAAWVVELDDETLRDTPELVGRRFSATEEALFNALLFGPNDGDRQALRDVEALTRAYVDLVTADHSLGGDVLRRKLRWAVSLTAGGSCDSCAAILVAGVRSLRE